MSRQSIQKRISKHKEELVLDLFEVVRLEGFHEDEEDYYYIFTSIHRGRVYSSCCIGFVPLKGKIGDKEYKELERVFKLNIKKEK